MIRSCWLPYNNTCYSLVGQFSKFCPCFWNRNPEVSLVVACRTEYTLHKDPLPTHPPTHPNTFNKPLCILNSCLLLHKYVLVSDSCHTSFIGGMEILSLRFNSYVTPASSYGLRWFHYMIVAVWNCEWVCHCNRHRRLKLWNVRVGLPVSLSLRINEKYIARSINK